MNILSSVYRYLFSSNNLSYLIGLSFFFCLLACLLAVIFPYGRLEGFGKAVISLLNSQDKGDAVRQLGIAIGGSMLFLQLVISDRRAKAAEDSANAQTKANENVERGQRQERLKNAIQHLGHDSVSIRLGGAYELFHLAQDTEELRQTVLDILCSHIRRTTAENDYRDKHSSEPSEEIQSLLTLLFVQEHEVFKGLDINLQGSWLNGAKLRNARLSKAILTEVYLQKAWLHDAHLQKTNLARAQLREAILPRVKLQGAVLQYAYLPGSNLGEANLQGSDLFATRLQLANLEDAHMQGVNLNYARLAGANLSRSRLQGANLDWATLIAASLDQVHLEGVRSQSWSMQVPFADRIRMLIDEETDLSRVTFEGIEQGGVDALKQDLSPDKANELQEILRHHIGTPLTRQLPQDSGAITGSYTKEEAEQWIAEYEEAMSKIPEGDNG